MRRHFPQSRSLAMPRKKIARKHIPRLTAALAAYAGTTTTNLAHMLKAFHEEGVIRALTPRRFEILDEARLAAALEHHPEN